MKGSVMKRCTCPVQRNGRGQRVACKRDHGSWSYVLDTGRGPDGKRRQEKRGGFRTRDDAEAALAAAARAVADGQHAHDGGTTVGEWLDDWLADKVAAGLRPTTRRSYDQHVRDYLRPHLGHLRLRDLRPPHVAAMVRKLGADGPSPATVRRIVATLRSALTSAHRQQLVAYNAAANLELPTAPRPRVRPWEPADLGGFLDHAASDRLGPLFELLAATGLRRGEAVGLRWDDVDLDAGRLVVRQQLVQVGAGDEQPCPYCPRVHRGAAFGPPKTASGEARRVDLDRHTVGVLLAQRLRQDTEREPWRDAYTDHGLVFCREDGDPLRLDAVSKRFRELAAEAGAPALTLHGLRHGAASLMLAAGVDVAIVSKRLGHSSIAITSDTYSHLLDGVGREAAERASALVPRSPRGDQSRDQCDQPVTNSP